MTMSNPKVEFIGWHKSAVELVGEKLLEMERVEPEAFRRATVVVPTAESGRRLKEWMAEKAGRPLLMPRMALAGQLIKTGGEGVATELETLAAWVETLTERPPHEAWPALFRQPVPERHLQTWAIGTADRLEKLALQLEQYEVSIPAVLRRLSSKEDMPAEFVLRWGAVEDEEKERWNTLKELINRVDEKLFAWGKLPGWAARAKVLKAPAPAQGAPIIIACLPELSPQVQRYLGCMEAACPGRVRIWVNAPEQLQEGFDMQRCGCLRVDYWLHYVFDEESLSDEQIQMTSSAQSLARATVAAMSSADSNDEIVLGTCDASFTPALVTELAKHGWQLHLPEGRSAGNTDLHALLKLLSAAVEAPESVSAVEPLLRSSAMQRLWSGKLQAYEFCRLLDKLQQRYYADSVSYLLKLLDTRAPLPGLRQSGGWLDGSAAEPDAAHINEREVIELESMRSPSFCQYARWVVDFVRLCCEDIEKGLHSLNAALCKAYSGHALQPVAAAIRGLVGSMSEFLWRHPLRPREVWTLLLHMLAQQRVALQESAREKTQVDALGWRELAYACGSRLIITGLHEGCVPELLPADPLLPDSLRQILGLPSTPAREARDTFLLAALLHRDKVAVHMLLAQQAADGSGAPVAPSGLLYRCPDAVLARRVSDKLFVEIKPDEAEKYGEWSLSPQGAPPGDSGMESVEMITPPGWVNPFAHAEHRFTPSEINSFLACPLRFWMKRALGISSWDEYRGDNKVEMSPAEYGTLMHNVLEDVARRYPRRELVSSEDDVLDFAAARLAERCLERFGERHLLPTIRRQINHIRSGLKPFVEWHCRELGLGWVCYDCEHKVTDWEFTLPDETTALVSMRADRIDYIPGTSRWRIVDYKTHNEIPIKKHLASIPERKRLCSGDERLAKDSFAQLMGPAGFELYMESMYWRDVQLPMYAAWLQQEMHCALPEVGYLNLPRVGHEHEGYNAMSELSDEALESALQWAGRAIMLMRSGFCLYSAESLGLSAPGASHEDDGPSDPRNLFANLRKILS